MSLSMLTELVMGIRISSFLGNAERIMFLETPPIHLPLCRTINMSSRLSIMHAQLMLEFPDAVPLVGFMTRDRVRSFFHASDQSQLADLKMDALRTRLGRGAGGFALQRGSVGAFALCQKTLNLSSSVTRFLCRIQSCSL